MESVNLLLTLALLVCVGAIVYAANLDALGGEGPRRSRPLLYALLAGLVLYAFLLFEAAFPGPLQPAISADAGPVDRGAALLCALLTVLTAVTGLLLLRSPRAGVLLARVLHRTGFDPHAPVHIVAIVLSLSLLVYTLSGLALSGGLQGMAQQIEQSGGVGIGETLLNQLLWLLVALLGVGLFIRRTPAQTAERLGLRWPTAGDVARGLGAGLGMVLVVFAFTALWAALVTPEQLAQQTAASQMLARSFDTVPAAFVLSLAVAVGEEVFFRGALQPVFGIGLTTVFFALLHTQYTLTPATLGIVLVSLVLGVLRQRRGTVPAILAHFIYNFVQLVLAILAASVLGAA